MSEAESALPPCIEVLEGRSRGRVFELVRRQIVIGRSPGADLHIDDAGVSRRHVKLGLLADGSVVATDMRSTNGMFVNGDKLEQATLGEGDLLRLGPDAVLRFSRLGAKTVRATSQAVAELDPRAAEQLESTQDEPRRPKLDGLELSARQIEVGRLVAAGLTNAVIGSRLGISHRTVTSHLDHIYARLGIGSRAALARWIVEHGLLEP